MTVTFTISTGTAYHARTSHVWNPVHQLPSGSLSGGLVGSYEEVTVRRFIRGTGWSMISLGAFTLYFLVYQLVGTNGITARAQDELREGLLQDQAAASPASTEEISETAPQSAQAAWLMTIPRLEMQDFVVMGDSSRESLRQGLGWIETKECLPGQDCTIGISGHRTTYGAPFFNAQELVPGDQINVTTAQAEYVYEVTGQKIVTPEQISVLDDVPGEDGTPQPMLVLTTCHPQFSAAQRLIIESELVETRPAGSGSA